jgi:hypothetical protein
MQQPSVKAIMAAIAGLAAAVVPAWAQLSIQSGGGQVNLSGATLFAPFYPTLSLSNDFINVDNDFTSCGTPRAGFYDSNCPVDGYGDSVDQLATSFSCTMSTFWAINIRGVGSGSGLAEFRDFQLCGTIPSSIPAEGGWFNRTVYASNGSVVNVGCSAGPSGTPFAQTSIDIGVMDVPTSWFVQIAGTPSWDATPGVAGYGTNAKTSKPTAGGLLGGDSNKLKTLCTTACGGGSLCLNIDHSLPSPLPATTVYDTQVAWVPVAVIGNRGTGISSLKYSEMQYLWATGRLPNGENLKAATRDAGSGTRNAIMNSIGVDPSWGVGDNVGKKIDDSAKTKLGPTAQWNNCGGSGMMEAAVQNHVLAIGYTGLMGAGRAANDATIGYYEILGVAKDRGTPSCDSESIVRPTLTATIDNADACGGYQVGGPETFATMGDPNANRDASDPKKTSNNPMSNSTAADFVNNLMDSIASFAGDPGGRSKDYFMPGEWLADTFLLPDGLEALPGATPSEFTPVDNRNVALRDYMLTYNNMGFGGDTPDYGTTCAGLVPGRVAGTYTDGTGDGRYFYKDDSGTLQNVTSGKRLSERNRPAGDFNGDGLRNIADIPSMMRAVDLQLDFDKTNHGGCYDGTAMTGDYLIVTIVGDFDGDGNFSANDVRYFADGLALQNGQLNRKEAFIDVDTVWSSLKSDNNYFDTTLATCKPYAAGDARGDVTGSVVGAAPGAMPQGANGVIDLADVEYVKANIGNWANLGSAVKIDLSADMNGDMNVTSDDVVEIVETILGTGMGDLNLDGTVDAADGAILSANLGLATGAKYADGDLDCDGDVDSQDDAILHANLGFRMSCLPSLAGDIDQDGDVDIHDFEALESCGSGDKIPHDGTPLCQRSDLDGDGDVDQIDFAILQRSYTNGE